MSSIPYALHFPSGPEIPLVCDSPHSGIDYPADFTHAVDRALLRSGEDTHVDVLWGAVPSVGGTLLAARFPRTYIDCNRTEDDLDPALLDGPWPMPLNPGEKTRLGSGLVWSRVSDGQPIYDGPLSVHAVWQRIERYYRPYHEALGRTVEAAVERFGVVWHLNLHSMPNNAYERLHIKASQPLADFVLGDRDGTTCDPAFVDVVETVLRDRGYTVARNDPYKGVQLIAKIGQPALNRNSLQIEMRRPLYMDEVTREPHEGFTRVQADLEVLLKASASYIWQRLSARPRPSNARDFNGNTVFKPVRL